MPDRLERMFIQSVYLADKLAGTDLLDDSRVGYLGSNVLADL